MLPGTICVPTLSISLFIVIIQSCNSRTGPRGRQLYKSQKTHLIFDFSLQTFRGFSSPMVSMSNCFKGSSTRETLFSLVAVLTWTGSSLVAQWLGFWAFTDGAQVQIPVREATASGWANFAGKNNNSSKMGYWAPIWLSNLSSVLSSYVNLG